MPIDRYAEYSENRKGLEAEPRERLMPRTLQEQLDRVERDIKLFTEFDRAEKARLNRESYLWTAEDRIEWQETQSDNARRLRELLDEREALRRQSVKPTVVDAAIRKGDMAALPGPASRMPPLRSYPHSPFDCFAVSDVLGRHAARRNRND